MANTSYNLHCNSLIPYSHCVTAFKLTDFITNTTATQNSHSSFQQIITSNVELIYLIMGQVCIGFPFCQNSSGIVLPLSHSQILIIKNTIATQIHIFPFNKLLPPTKFFEIYIVISLLKLRSFVCYRRLGGLMHSHIPTPQKKFKSHTQEYQYQGVGLVVSKSRVTHTHTHYCILSHSFYSQSLMVLPFFKF